nr:unnamed protein product [Callosobruchus analis]
MNIQSLRNKTLELEVALKTLNTDYQIICLSETWLKQEEVQFIKLEGYTLRSSYSRTEIQHGGVCIFVKKEEENFEELEDLNHYCIEGHIEICSLINKTDKILIFCVYRSCNGSFDIFLEVFERLGREVSARFINYKTIWAGDFNINLAPSWNIPTGDACLRKPQPDGLTNDFQSFLRGTTGMQRKRVRTVMDCVRANEAVRVNNRNGPEKGFT